jgi:tetraacyldisaccharide 4'-kinase
MNSCQGSRRGLSFERLMYGFSKVYENGIQFRNNLYKTGILKIKKLPCFVVSIGNITAGGTGKTPMTIYLCKYFTALGFKVAVVTRGYKGELEHKGGVVSDGKRILCNPEEAGDEAYMMAQILKSPVIAGKKRFESGMTAIEKYSSDIIILDDAFQHMALKRDLNLLLLDTKKPLGNGYLLPRGTLREPAASIHRSDAIIFTRSDQNPDTVFDHTNINSKRIPLFKSIHVPYVIRIATGENNIQSLEAQSDILNHIKGKRAFLFSGIANNSAFKNSCENLKLIVCHHIQFPDHYQYTQPEIDTITESFNQSNAEYIVTTHKDYIKITNIFPSDYPILILGVKIEFDSNNKKYFEQFIEKKIQKHFRETQALD